MSEHLNGSDHDQSILRAIGSGAGTRRELKEATGLGYDVIEKCLERNAGDLRVKIVGQIEIFELAIATTNGDAVVHKPEKQPPRSPRPELDANDLAHREAAKNGDSVIHESTKSGAEASPKVEYCFCGREQPPGGKHRGTHRNKAAREAKQSAKNPDKKLPTERTPETTGIAQPERVEAVEPDKKPDKLFEKHPTVIEGFMRFNITLNLSVSEMADWNPYDITKFFEALATLQKLGAFTAERKTSERLR